MAVDQSAVIAAQELADVIPPSVTGRAFALYYTEQKIEHLRELEKALRYLLSREEHCTVARGDSFDLFIETCGSSAKVTRVKRARS